MRIRLNGTSTTYGRYHLGSLVGVSRKDQASQVPSLRGLLMPSVPGRIRLAFPLQWMPAAIEVVAEDVAIAHFASVEVVGPAAPLARTSPEIGCDTVIAFRHGVRVTGVWSADERIGDVPLPRLRQPFALATRRLPAPYGPDDRYRMLASEFFQPRGNR